MNATRTIHQDDALNWLATHKPLAGSSIITSMPDISEFPEFSLDKWKNWFVDAAALVLSRCPDDGITLFYQTDIKREGVWIDKGCLVQTAALQMGHELIAHKIVCRAAPGEVSFGRPSYSHLLAFSKTVRPEVGKATPDVLPQAGATTWTRGMGLEACRLACKFVRAHSNTHTILDPFCGHGSVLAVANEMGFNAIGVELSRKRAAKARTLTVESLL